jgi:hypothetical protein
MRTSAQERAAAGAKLTAAEREAVAMMATRLRRIATSPEHRADAAFDNDPLLDLADALDQVALPIVIAPRA